MTNINSPISKNILLNQLVNKQLNDIPTDLKLSYSDLKRICKYINTSIFNDDICSIWNGYITNNNINKGKYINFYFMKKKVALHRLLYRNFVDNITSTEYIRFSCNNKGICCNITHMQKYKYNMKNNKKKNKIKKDNQLNSLNKFTINFN